MCALTCMAHTTSAAVPVQSVLYTFWSWGQGTEVPDLKRGRKKSNTCTHTWVEGEGEKCQTFLLCSGSLLGLCLLLGFPSSLLVNSVVIPSTPAGVHLHVSGTLLPC